MGFEPDEAAANMLLRQAEIPGMYRNGNLFDRPPVLLQTLDSAPDLTGLDADVAARVKVKEQPDGTVTVSIDGDIPEELEQKLLATAKSPERRATMRAAVHRHRIIRRNSISPAARGEKFAVPRLYLYIQGKMEFVEEELILDLGGWTLSNYAAELSLAEFAIRETAERWEVDLKGEKVVYRHLDQTIQLELGLLKLDWTDRQLSRWLDKECRQPDITQPVLLEFCRKVVAWLMEKRGLSLNELLRFKYQLAKALQQKIKAYRQQAYASGYQTFLFGPKAQVETSFADGFAFERDRPYPAAWFYQGAYQFKNHFFGMVGELESKGEEFECAKLIDNLPQVKHWIRNLAGRPQTSFWLPTSTDRFYPDFVAQLQDGRIFVIEYKGAHLVDTQDTKEKQNIGELWAAKSGGKGLFLMAEKLNSQGRDTYAQILAAIT
jgi:type III restriction enzyme